MKQKIKLIKHGLEDAEIKKEQEKKAKTSRITTICVNVVSLLVCVALLAAFAFSLHLQFTKDKAPNGIPSLKVVKTSSMATRNEKNTYLFKNNLTEKATLIESSLAYKGDTFGNCYTSQSIT